MSLLVAMTFVACDQAKDEEEQPTPDVTVVDAFPEGVATASGSHKCNTTYGTGEYTCGFQNGTAKTVYVKVGNEIVAIKAGASARMTSSSSTCSFTYAPSDSIKLGTNSYSVAGTVKFMSASVTTGSIKLVNGLARNNQSASFTNITITDVATNTVWKADNSPIPFSGTNGTRTYNTCRQAKSTRYRLRG